MVTGIHLVERLLLILAGIGIAHCMSHYCPTTYSVKVTTSRVESYICGDGWSCSWWSCHHNVRTCYHHRFYNTYETRTNHYTCCRGWKGSRCDIPICNSPCKNNALCITPDDCFCQTGSGGNQCEIKVCSAFIDCYPGTCADATCYCNAGFEGSNCDKMLDGPDFQRCTVTLADIQDGRFAASCGLPGKAEEYTYYTNQRDIKSVLIDMETVYVYPGDVPYKPPYMPDSAVGNVESYANVALRRDDGSVVQSGIRMTCDDRVSPSAPYAAAECRNKSYAWNHAIGHGYEMEINMYGTSGGYKKINNPQTQRIDQRLFTGVANNQTVVFVFDILAPYHCHEDLSENCTANFPPVLTLEQTMEANLTIECTGWSDYGTGLSTYTYELFKMVLNSQDKFEHSDATIFTSKLQLLDLTTPVVFKVLPEPGRYSAVLTVEDKAGNTKKARSLLIFDNSHQIAVRPGKTIRLMGDVQGPHHRWLTNFTKGGLTEMTAFLGDVFHNPFHLSKKLLNAAEPFPSEWGYEDTFGNLTTDPITNIDGIIGFEFAFGVDQAGGESVISNPPELKPVYPPGIEVGLSRTINDKDTIVLMVKAYDAVGDSKSQTVSVHVDSTPPVTNSASFTKDVNATDQEETPYASNLAVIARDEDSGIAFVKYEIYDSKGARIAQASMGNFSLPEGGSSTCPSGDCFYCTSLKECFLRELPVAIDNCVFMNSLEERLSIKYTVINSALLETAGPEDVAIGPLYTVYGLNEYPSGSSFQAVNISDKHVDLVWTYPKSCYTPTGAIITLGDSEYNVDYPRATYTLSNLNAETLYSVGLVIKYDAKNSPLIALPITTAPEDCLGQGCETGGFGAGTIVGIIIAILLICGIAAMVILIVMRRRANKPPMPDGIRHLGNTIRNRFSRHGGHGQGQASQHTNHYEERAVAQTQHNPSYGIDSNRCAQNTLQHRQTRGVLNVSYMPGLQGTDDDIYTYGDLETDPNATWKHSSDEVVLGAVISTGRFAEIRKASLNSTTTVVAKTLKAGASADDNLLMKAKMNFLATSVPPHENLVNLVGAVPTGNPVILLEYCEQTLKDWLNNNVNVTEDVEDEMIQFSIQTAQAMAHLTENNIVHRRLGVRNILLHEINGHSVAKVTGFGPMKAERETGNAEREKIPMKWMAPEQINGRAGQNRVYDEKTDVWTYGITLWEIFSKGESPYKEFKHGELAQLHRSGFRLPRPGHGPADIYPDFMLACWAKEPAARPTFDEIRSSLRRHYGGAAAGDEYYYEESEGAKATSVKRDLHDATNNLYGNP